VAVAVGALVLVAGCTSTGGGGGGKGTRSASTSSANPSPSRSRSASLPPADIVRTPVQTAIGDPVTADLCSAMGLDPLRGLGAGLTPSFDARQYPPGCSVTLRNAAKAVLGLSVFADRRTPREAAGRTRRVTAGLPVYGYPYDSSTGSCERDISSSGLRLVVDAFAPGPDKPDQSLSCAAADAMADRIAAVVAAGGVPRLPLAAPSLTALNGCKVVRRAGIPALPDFAGSEVIPRGFGANCELRRGALFLFLDIQIAGSARPRGSNPTTVEGHRLYETSAQGGYCTYVSNQGSTADGRHEQLSATSTVVGTATPPADMCGQTAQALARYLTAAGLT
jgi:hypothetical protein